MDGLHICSWGGHRSSQQHEVGRDSGTGSICGGSSGVRGEKGGARSQAYVSKSWQQGLQYLDGADIAAVSAQLVTCILRHI